MSKIIFVESNRYINTYVISCIERERKKKEMRKRSEDITGDRI